MLTPCSCSKKDEIKKSSEVSQKKFGLLPYNEGRKEGKHTGQVEHRHTMTAQGHMQDNEHHLKANSNIILGIA